MADGIRVGVALSCKAERALITTWLEAEGNAVVPLVEACYVNMEVAERGFGCVLADAELLQGGFWVALRRQNSPVPIVAVVDAGAELPPELDHPSVTTLSRPIEQPALTLAVSLAYGESRQLRRSVRWRAPRLPATAGGAAAEILDVSADGLCLELSKTHRANLRPQFHLQVPILKLDVVVRRVWVRPGAGDRVQCGASLVAPDATERLAWELLVDLAKSSGSMTKKRAEGTVGGRGTHRTFEPVSKGIELVPLMRSLAGRLLGGRS